MLSVNNVSKQFDQVKALSNVNFSINDGTILGLIGQNGAGKTTLFHSTLNFISHDGEILWNGEPITEKSFDEVGYLPEERSLLPKMTIEQQVTYLAALKGMPAKMVSQKLPGWMKKFEVKGKPTDKIKDLSKGNQQKVQLICTLIHDPKFIILDEPFSGLDPVNASLLKAAILEAKANGATIIFSSHDMNNVEEICDELVMLKDGHVVLHGPVNQVRNQYPRTKLIISPTIPISDVATIPGVIDAKQFSDHYQLTLSSEEVGKVVFKRVSNGEYIETFSQQAPSLDEIFRMKVGEIDE
ncbi:ABC transporter ATP-binding protein [Lentilactobacillus sp. Marseille-Q4993]|uniref:ABC transporter ATP-binding protein n=1 Tax=Lentilactobacillus sp. Marseille-Q4993 TaxID=3039492 RepID=UPI0024BCAB70|nr:ABC transporter ATP-binding protein [Lentilactobacillus sp. Marseille-Q4993]